MYLKMDQRISFSPYQFVFIFSLYSIFSYILTKKQIQKVDRKLLKPNYFINRQN